jgi:hypothetical protein
VLREQTAVLFVNSLCNGWLFERKSKNRLSCWQVYGKSCIPRHPVLTSRKCCCYYVQCSPSVQLFLVDVWIFHVSGRVNRNDSTTVSVNGQGTHMPNGCKVCRGNAQCRNYSSVTVSTFHLHPMVTSVEQL